MSEQNYELVPVAENSSEDSSTKSNGFSMIGAYDKIQIKAGRIQFTVDVPLSENLSKIKKLSEMSGETTAFFLQFQQDELDIDEE